MPIVERKLTGFVPVDATVGPTTQFSLQSASGTRYPGYTWRLSFPLPSAYRIQLSGPHRDPPPNENVVLQPRCHPFRILSISSTSAVLSFPRPQPGSSDSRTIEVEWSGALVATCFENGVRVIGDLPDRSYMLTEHGIARYYRMPSDCMHLGLGERAGPVDLSGRRFEMHAADSANYVAEGVGSTDPLYKHCPWLISAPIGAIRPAYGIFHSSNAFGVWNVGVLRDAHFGEFKSYTQDYDGLDEWVIIGSGVKEIVQTFSEIVGKPRLIGRDWLGYLASAMSIADSDQPPAQELLEAWPTQCAAHGIPCSAMHLSSGYTVDEGDGNRYVFHLNKKRYPDFAGMVAKYHQAGMKLVPNVKPYLVKTHPSYERLKSGGGLFIDPHTSGVPECDLWAGGKVQHQPGSWSDLTSEVAWTWWVEGCQHLADLGVDGIWNDNNEYYLLDDAATSSNGRSIGSMGRLYWSELMAKASREALESMNPGRRPYVLTRSSNIGAIKYISSTWSGDNNTSWSTLRGSQAIQINSGLSLFQSSGSDVGGFLGPSPDPELLVRWMQLGVTHARFCIHSNKAVATTPWMVSYSLMWDSHRSATPTNAWLGWGEFQQDPNVYRNDTDAWIGAGQLLCAPALEQGMTSRRVYFPRASLTDAKVYFDLSSDSIYAAGTSHEIQTPLRYHGVFAREGSCIPIGKPVVTVTQLRVSSNRGEGDACLVEDGGQVEADDWRGLMLFPSREQTSGSYTGKWTEDDGISANPEVSVIHVEYRVVEGMVLVGLKWNPSNYRPLWTKLTIILPIGDERVVKGGKKTLWQGRQAWLVEVV